MDILTLGMLFDTHLHLRVGSMMETVIRLITSYCQTGVVMPNTANIRTAKDAARHRDEIKAIAAMAGYPDFNPLMTVMLTDETDPADVEYWPESGVVAGKWYPKSLYPHGGVSGIDKVRDVLNEMTQAGIICSRHFENVGFHPLEAEQMDMHELYHLKKNFPDLRIVFEHASTAKAVNEVMQSGPNVAATIAPQHLWLTAESVFNQYRVVVNFHNWCRPPMKTADDREALRVAAMSGNPKFFLGSDFAPHPESAKLAWKPAAGVANYPAALPLLAALFEQYDRLDRLEGFTSIHAAQFYRIELRDEKITLVKKSSKVPESIPLFGTDGSDPTQRIIPWLAGEEFPWSLAA